MYVFFYKLYALKFRALTQRYQIVIEKYRWKNIKQENNHSYQRFIA